MSLNDRQEKFCRAYVANGGNATKAAIDAGYSAKTANPQAARLLAKVSIREFIDSLKKPMQEQLGITAEWVRQRLKEEALLQRHQGGSQSGRIKALELLGRDVGMFTGESSEDEDRTWVIEVETIDVGDAG